MAHEMASLPVALMDTMLAVLMETKAVVVMDDELVDEMVE